MLANGGKAKTIHMDRAAWIVLIKKNYFDLQLVGGRRQRNRHIVTLRRQGLNEIHLTKNKQIAGAWIYFSCCLATANHLKNVNIAKMSPLE